MREQWRFGSWSLEGYFVALAFRFVDGLEALLALAYVWTVTYGRSV